MVDTLILLDFGKSSIFASNTTEALTKLLIGTVFREKHVSEVCLWFRHFLDLKQKGFDTQGGYFCVYGVLASKQTISAKSESLFCLSKFIKPVEFSKQEANPKNVFFRES